MTVQEAIEARRSVHSYDTTRDVTEEQLKELIDASILAPSSFNLNHWRFIVVRSEEGRDKLYRGSLNQKHILEAPVVLILLGKINAHEDVDLFTEDWISKGYYPDDDHLKKVSGGFYGMNPPIQRDEALRSPSIMTGMLMLKAVDMGLSTAAIIGFKPPVIKEEFNIPENYEIAMMITVGYEKDPMPLRVMRLPYEQVTCEETFGF